MCACTLVYVTCLNSISRQRGDPDESLLPLEPELLRFSDTSIGIYADTSGIGIGSVSVSDRYR